MVVNPRRVLLSWEPLDCNVHPKNNSVNGNSTELHRPPPPTPARVGLHCIQRCTCSIPHLVPLAPNAHPIHYSISHGPHIGQK
jgi:hypothetical protein